MAAMMAAETGIDVDTMKVVIDPESRLAPWSRYETVLTALDATPDATRWFARAHDDLARTLPEWRAPSPDIADITTPADFMGALRRMLEAPHPISVVALARQMASRDSRNTWRRTALGDILKASTLPPASKRESVRNLLATLCANDQRPMEDVDYLFDTWLRLQPDASRPRPAVFVPHRPPSQTRTPIPPLGLPQGQAECSYRSEQDTPRTRAAGALVITGIILVIVIVIVIVIALLLAVL
ncbi:hypothetical protein QRX50_46755 [Amycolatopsis carbonis]|uniref:Uncharacterized protein n=1 Tax=Amycolatopsis carbonis TaxID=715471 RepID=A0A9Y2IFY7_9PSEU|nr:hypothetical protein [Amycolatopsis sp. 2-15]WIX78754.1 hypothetical protein QRX50_46755 [Amycolatopsis sp. 2-15]